MLRKIISIFILICTMICAFSSCLELDEEYSDIFDDDLSSSDDGDGDITQVTVTMDEEDFIGMPYTEAEELLREMGFKIFEYKTLETDDINKPDDTIASVDIMTWIFSSGDFSSGDMFDDDVTVVLYYYICNEPVPNLTIENCPELADLLNLKDPSDPSVSSFVNKYRGQIIEFDGCVIAMQNHKDYKTRWDVMFGAGDFDENSVKGPYFHLTDVNYYEMNVSGGDSVYVGLNVYIVAEVDSYNPNTTWFELEIISIEIRD